MSALTVTTPDTAAGSPSHDHLSALLTARAGLEPELAARYSSDPLSVLTELGLPAAEPVYLDGPEAVGDGPGLVIEDLDRPDTSAALACWVTSGALAGYHAETVGA